MAALLALAISLSTVTSEPTTTTLPPPGAGLGLMPGPAVRPAAPGSSADVIRRVPVAPDTGAPTRSLFFAGVIAALVAALQAAVAQRNRRIASIPSAPWDVTVLFVPGFDQPRESEFAQLIDWMQLSPDQVHYFDYRWVEPAGSHEAATRRSDNDELVDGLHAHLAGMASMSDRPIYLIGFSKGGAAIASLLTRWDRRPDTALPSVIGAALLDPPISGRLFGMLQSVGSFISVLPNDGGYTPTHCGFLGHFACHDTRVDLGKDAGVEVVVFRHEDSHLANFRDRPEGLRVYELEGGLPPDLGISGRITTAHSAVFTSPAVASCIAEEMRRLRTCEWDGGE